MLAMDKNLDNILNQALAVCRTKALKAPSVVISISFSIRDLE